MDAPADLIIEMRVRMGSPDAAEMPDSTIDTYLKIALRKYNKYRPPERAATLSLTADVSLYDPPSGVAIGRVRRVFYESSFSPTTGPGLVAPGDASLSEDLAGLSPADNWVEATDHLASNARGAKLYGARVFCEAGKIVVSPAPGEAVDVRIIYSGKYIWDDIWDADAEDFADADAEGIFEDLALYTLGEGYAKLASSRRRIRAVSRIGQSTSFASGEEEASNAKIYRDKWHARVVRPRIGPRR